MEDMARLAVLEQSVGNEQQFCQVLQELLQCIWSIVANPYDLEPRTITNDTVKAFLNLESFSGYLNYLGFNLDGDIITLPKEQSLNKLRIAHASILRKLSVIKGTSYKVDCNVTKSKPGNKDRLTYIQVLTTKNKFLIKLQDLFNFVLVYEDIELLRLARETVPMVSLQTRALDRIRDQQKQIKTGEIEVPDLSFEIAQLLELLGWFKHSFFKWMDKPDCDTCGDTTQFIKTATMTTNFETCKVEVYKCPGCGADQQFPRYNDPRMLLSTRRGRCGEWANCFALFCRALGYDTRYVYDATDHVWCEVFDYESKRWLHVDPCEALLDAPLIYEHGWKKKLSYIIAFSRDDIQDVTWRYSSQHKEVLRRRQLCSEQELMDAIMTLRHARQCQVSEPRRKHLAKRCVEELAQILVERQPGDYESHGRVSGAEAWRRERGEIGEASQSYTFHLPTPGQYNIKYYMGMDQYKVIKDETELETITGWITGTFACKSVFKKREMDWKMVYLAREEGASFGSLSWKLSTNDDCIVTSVAIRLISKVYEDGIIKWTLKFDNDEPINVQLGESITTFQNQFKELLITAVLSGGKGDVAWQHSQLFRQPINSDTPSMEIMTAVKNVAN